MYRFNGTSPPTMLAIASIPAFNPGSPELRGAISAPDLIWSGRGDKVVAFSSALRSLALFDYLDGSPASLQASSGLVQCAPDTSNPEWIPLPAAMLSSNRAPYIPPPTPIPTDTARPSTSPTDTATPTYTPSATPSITATSSATSTATATLSPTRSPTPTPALAYRPLLLRERCLPEQRRLDVVLVLDASLSMLEPAGQEAPPAAAASKLDAARAAALAFLDALHLDACGPRRPGRHRGLQQRRHPPQPAHRRPRRPGRGHRRHRPRPQTCIVCAVETAAAELASDRRRADVAACPHPAHRRPLQPPARRAGGGAGPGRQGRRGAHLHHRPGYGPGRGRRAPDGLRTRGLPPRPAQPS